MKLMNFKVLAFFPMLLLIVVIEVACSQKNQSLYDEIVDHPKYFEGKTIKVEGFFQYDGESLLYKDALTAKNLEFNGAILVQDKSINNELVDQCGGQNVRVSGRVVLKYDRAKLIDIDTVYSMDRNVVCWASKYDRTSAGFNP